MTASPSRRIDTSSPSNRNSLGSRTAWLLPFRNNLAIPIFSTSLVERLGKAELRIRRYFGIAPVNTYACKSAMSPISPAPATECHQTRRKIGPRAWERSYSSS